jgi:hypothetical protein
VLPPSCLPPPIDGRPGARASARTRNLGYDRHAC